MRLHNVTRCINYQRLFQPVTINISKRQVWKINGPNGVGKSSLLKILAGLISYDGAYHNSYSVSYLGHKAGLYEFLNVSEYLDYFSTWHNYNYSGSLNLWNINANKKLGLLSAGQKQAVALIRTCMTNRICWILDEPTHSLDASRAKRLYNLCLEHKNNNGIIIFTSHISNDIMNELVTHELELLQ